ncbi:hypothetical protein D3C81_1879180 [compost metagenome]
MRRHVRDWVTDYDIAKTEVLIANENIRYCSLHGRSRRSDDSPYATLNGTYGKNHILPYVVITSLLAGDATAPRPKSFYLFYCRRDGRGFRLL